MWKARVFTLYPEMFPGPLDIGLYKKARGFVTIAIRPEHLRFQHLYPGQPAGQITRREFKGHDLTYQVALGDQ